MTGAAIATTIGRSIGVLFGLSQFFRQSGRVHIHRRHLRLDPGLLFRLRRRLESAVTRVRIDELEEVAAIDTSYP